MQILEAPFIVTTSHIERHLDAIVIGANLYGASMGLALEELQQELGPLNYRVFEANGLHNKAGGSHGYARIWRPWFGSQGQQVIYQELAAHSFEMLLDFNPEAVKECSGQVIIPKNSPAYEMVSAAHQYNAERFVGRTLFKGPPPREFSHHELARIGWTISESDVSLVAPYAIFDPHAYLTSVYQKIAPNIHLSGVMGWTHDGSKFHVTTEDGKEYTSDRVFIAAGPATPQILLSFNQLTMPMAALAADHRVQHVCAMYIKEDMKPLIEGIDSQLVRKLYGMEGEGDIYGLSEMWNNAQGHKEHYFKLGFSRFTQEEEKRPPEVLPSDYDRVRKVWKELRGKEPDIAFPLMCKYVGLVSRNYVPVAGQIAGAPKGASIFTGCWGSGAKTCLAFSQSIVREGFGQAAKVNIKRFFSGDMYNTPLTPTINPVMPSPACVLS